MNEESYQREMDDQAQFEAEQEEWLESGKTADEWQGREVFEWGYS